MYIFFIIIISTSDYMGDCSKLMQYVKKKKNLSYSHELM